MESELENYDQEIRRIRGIEFPQMEGKFITNLVRILWCGVVSLATWTSGLRD